MSLKETLVGKPLLALFDPGRENRMTANASQYGLGAILLQLNPQGWKPVAYASRALADFDTRCLQIEKITLGITFDCERFHDFVYGRKIRVQTDHRPLLAFAKERHRRHASTTTKVVNQANEG